MLLGWMVTHKCCLHGHAQHAAAQCCSQVTCFEDAACTCAAFQGQGEDEEADLTGSQKQNAGIGQHKAGYKMVGTQLIPKPVL